MELDTTMPRKLVGRFLSIAIVITAIILGDFASRGFASRYLRRDGKIGWRATNKMREDLFERMQEALDEQEEF